jgi:hypothetical protein
MFGTVSSIALGARHRAGPAIQPSLLMALVDAARFRARSHRCNCIARRRASIACYDDEVRAA